MNWKKVIRGRLDFFWIALKKFNDDHGFFLSMVYGSLSTLIIFVLWVYYSSVILILGGEVAYFLESERRHK